MMGNMWTPILLSWFKEHTGLCYSKVGSSQIESTLCLVMLEFTTSFNLSSTSFFFTDLCYSIIC